MTTSSTTSPTADRTAGCTTAHTAAPTTDLRTDRIAPQLDREWAALRRRRRALEQVAGWQIVDVTIDDLDELLRLAGSRTSVCPETERVMRELVLLGRHDDLAARIVLQRLLPGLLATVRRRRHRTNGSDGLLEELVGAAWITIRTFDPARQPSCLAAALVRGAEHRAFTAGTRRRRVDEVYAEPQALDRVIDLDEPEPLVELADLFALARRSQIDEADLRLLTRLLRLGSPAALADELGVTTRTVQNRRSQITYRLRRIALAA